MSTDFIKGAVEFMRHVRAMKMGTIISGRDHHSRIAPMRTRRATPAALKRSDMGTRPTRVEAFRAAKEKSESRNGVAT